MTILCWKKLYSRRCGRRWKKVYLKCDYFLILINFKQTKTKTMKNKKEPLSLITVKTLLAVIIFTGVGMIIVGGGWLIGKQGKVSEPISGVPAEKCAKAGEGSSNPSLGPSAPTPRKCCEGLVEIYAGSRYEPNSEIADEDGCVNWEGSGNLCSDCGNGICESWENRCNCPEDCKEEIDTADWKTYNSKLSNLYLYSELKNPFTFKYPQNWLVSETKSGIEIYSKQFKVEIIPFWNDKDNREIKDWCKDLINSHYGDFKPEIFTEEYMVVSGINSYSIDYEYKEDKRYNVREICIPISNAKKMTIVGNSPKDLEFLSVYNQILSTFKFTEK